MRKHLTVEREHYAMHACKERTKKKWGTQKDELSFKMPAKTSKLRLGLKDKANEHNKRQLK